MESKNEINIRDSIGAKVQEDVAKCRAYLEEDPKCKKCIQVCPASKLSGLTIEDLNAATLGEAKPTNQVREFAFSCMQTARCDAPCPVGAKRSLMMLQLRSNFKKLPTVYTNYTRIRGTDIPWYYKIARLVHNYMKRKELGVLLKWNEKTKNLKEADTLFYFGCYINTPELCLDTLWLADFLGEDYEVLGGLTTCCGWPQYMQGQFDLASKYMNQLSEWINQAKPKKVYTSCMECWSAVKMIQEHYGFEWEALSTTDWIKDNLNRLGLPKVTEKVTFHDSCHRCHKADFVQPPRDILNSFTEVKELKLIGKKSICCGHYSYDYNEPNVINLRNGKINQAKNLGVDKMITECFTCEEVYAPHGKKLGLEVDNILSYVVNTMKGKKK